QANRTLQRWFHEALTDHELRELQLQAAAMAASRGVTCVHEMAIPASHGRREVEVLLDHRAQLPIEVLVYVAEQDIPSIMDLGLGARVPDAGFAAASSLPSPTSSHRALRAAPVRPDRTGSRPGPGYLGAARLRRRMGKSRAALRAASGARSRGRHEPLLDPVGT